MGWWRRERGWALARFAAIVVVPCVAIAVLLPGPPGRGRGGPMIRDHANLMRLYLWLEILRDRRGMPTEGGHRLLLQPWTSGMLDPTPENLRCFFNPGRRGRDPHYRELRARLLRGERIWTDLAQTTSRDTHYAALATPFLAHLFDKDQVIAADDCEDGWPFPGCVTHAINLLYGDGHVREMAFAELPVFGPSSPIPELQRLER
jgi:prepilin-type processing-associated H-X9-DG protein